MAETGAFVFLHASNRTVDRAWPVASGLPDKRFARMPGYDTESAPAVPFDQDAWESRLLRACPDGAVVVAHSFGGPVAMRAAARRPDLVRALVLFEPAAYALARGTPAVEDHVRRVQPVLDRAGSLDAASFAVAFGDAVSGRSDASAPTTPEGLLAAERQRMLPGPWTLDTPEHTGVPTLVVTGGWNDEYETIAAHVDGAAHVLLAGLGHRPQEHQDATRVVLDFVRAVSPR
ncbi:alpha/beta fold hydrolase [Curtobacterium sp. NPDC090217]|uniref:alpha/beta fold hydrolase n=1 Tax=Curtobacterium sp. NPDC090217 TaxID=3363970 RepID=UPI0038300B48